MNDVHVPGLGTFHRREHRSFGGPVDGPDREIVTVSWEAEVEWRGEAVTVSVPEDEVPRSGESVAEAGRRALAFLAREDTARREVVAAMLDLAEDWWAARDDEESETPLTAETFLAFLSLEAVVVEDDGGLTVYYDDDEEVFAGHAIQATFDAAGKLTDTDIPG